MTVHRSWLFVPGDDERKLARAGTSGADALIFDLEDAVVPARRDAARGLVADVLASPAEGGERWVRINPLDSPDALDDLAAVVRPGLAGVVLPKLRSAADVTQLGHQLDALEAREGLARGSVGILVVATETPEMVFRLGDLAGSSRRLRAVTWGAEDLSAALGAATNKDPDGGWDSPYELARSLCLLAATAAGAQPVDTLHAAFTDDDGLAASTRRAARQGYTGKLAIHPRQIPIINEGLTPSAAEVAEARAVVAAFDAAPEAGAVSLDGRMLDRPHLVQATRLIERASRHP
ncbi:MAG TPA: CoA ester lyase [Acidimicrobiales bacterium]